MFTTNTNKNTPSIYINEKTNKKVQSHHETDYVFNEFNYVSYNVVLEQQMLKFKNEKRMFLQSGDFCEEATSQLMDMLKRALHSANGLLESKEQEWFLVQIENFAQLIHWSQKCESISDYIAMTQLAYRLFSGKPLSLYIGKKIASLFENEVQSMDFNEAIKALRGAFDVTNRISDSPMMRKLVSLYSFLLTQGFLKCFGLELSDEEYSKIEQRAMLSAFSSKKAFFMCVFDTVLFVCEKIYEWRQTGDISTFIHSSDEYAKWLKEADRLLNLAPFVGNLAAHGTSYFSFVSNLKDAIERGEAYAKFTSSTAGVDCTYIKRKLSSLQLLLNTEVTRRAAQQERISPMGVLVYGSSSIAKSAFTKMLFNYYGGLFDLERDDQYRYVRNPMDEYWSNFDSSKWCIQLDDIAFMNPAKCSDVDSTLQDLLNVVNNVPYVPPQAALEDKGKTPVLAKLVIATSNCASLNAKEYFWCPLAVRRRLPFVVTVKPKREYLHSNMVFIDSQKLKTVDGQFPDFWDITVSEIKPLLDGHREDATLNKIATFTDVNKFLQFFGKACKQHEANQLKAMSKNDDMLTVKVCKDCLLPLPHEECVVLQSGTVNYFTSFMIWLISIFIQMKWVLCFLRYAAYYKLTRRYACTLVNYAANAETAVRFFGQLGEVAQDPRLKRVVLCVTLLSATFAGYFYLSQKKKDAIKREDAPVVQGNVHGTTEDQLLKEERSNVWYNPTIELTTFDVPRASASLAGASDDDIRNIFDRNCVLLHIRVVGGNSTRVMRATFIRGQQCITNGHAFRKEGKRYEVTIIQKHVAQGVSPNIKMELDRVDIAFDESSDLCLFEVNCLPPFKDITSWWSVTDFNPSSALEFSRHKDGTLSKNAIFALTYMPQTPVNELQGNFDIFFGHSTEMTEVGLCGSLCVAVTPRGPILFGIHMLGVNHNVGILKVTVEQINKLASQKCISQRPIVQGGGSPVLSCSEKINILTEPHHKSLFRYLETGSLNIYGSFSGFRPKPRSSVCATPLQKEFLEHYGKDVEYGKPCMTGWEPWRKNVVEMVKPYANYNKSILRECTQSFSEDIINGLPEGWEGDLVTLSNKASVNGLPGVMYVDRIATNTSMGFPWCCTKKKYILPDICEKYPEGVTFGPEIWDMVAAIEKLYDEGKRAYPIFSGHLKDEATPLKKVEMKKTRLFTGSSLPWSLVVRKKLLTFVRLLQKNKFVFEAGPGTVAQSAEWGHIRNYLIAFGDDRIVAGDYGKFDKRMLSDFILAAFEVIVNIFKKAGFSDVECRSLMCIGNDIAFPLSNINGDLVEFFGTNPSGHPLTVIINSLVNSLYMRYCYMSQNPAREVRSFQKNVHLFTYGDDNIMGVSRTANWFNHTAIRATLATIGVEYTMAEKEAQSIPFIKLEDCSFLKRKWVWNPDVENWVCPLDEDSIIKSLTMWVPSKTIDSYAQIVAVITSANSEYFFYGREKFEKEHKFFAELLKREPYSFYVTETTLPTYDELVERFHRASRALEN
ncbi:hypothetical protein 1 [Hubei leech virus 4]|uniref:hypothetical protein 1 n=1 Tax=Hubei leech virus 4 TaxID=1922902 RepID=UPI000909B3AA|nr:hypothetical protein 1 [Hubei leech virus 4]APG77494.1 hypothetical protein 1 [Hubei leech virus 4]